MSGEEWPAPPEPGEDARGPGRYVMLLVGVALFGVLLWVVLAYQSSLASKLGDLFALLLLAGFSVLAALVLNFGMGAANVLKSSKVRLVGAAAVCLALFGLLLRGYQELRKPGPPEWTVRGRVDGLDGRVAQVALHGGCTTRTDERGEFTVVAHGDCQSDPLRFTVYVEGFEPFEHSLAADAREAPVALAWKAAAGRPRELARTFRLPDGTPLARAAVQLHGCGPVMETVTKDDGSFRLAPLPPGCNPPYALRVHHGSWVDLQVAADRGPFLDVDPLEKPTLDTVEAVS